MHFRDVENTFEYYQPFYVSDISPTAISNEGNSYLKIKAINFNEFKFDNGTHKEVPIACRYYDSYSQAAVADPVYMSKISETEFECKAPKTT